MAHTRASFIAGTSLGVICALCVLALAFVRPVIPVTGSSVHDRLRQYAHDLMDLGRIPASRFILILAVLPIGIAGVSNFWSAIGGEWGASPNTIALMIGPLEAVAAIVGCLFAGWLADRIDRRAVFLSAGLALCLVELALSLAPRHPLSFVFGTFAVSLLLAMADAAFTALVLTLIGIRGAATRYAIFLGLGNIPDIYMTSLSGYVHDARGLGVMLQVEAILSLLCILMASTYAAAQSKRGLGAQFVAARETEPA
jgi:predicted MFS family arabinose efflux permease